MIKAIFFDAAGILYVRSSPTESFARQLLQEHGFNPDISTEQQEGLMLIRTKANSGGVSHEYYWDQYLAVRGVSSLEQRKDISRQIITFSNDVQAVPGARDALQALKQNGVVLGIITDTMYPMEWKMARLRRAGVADLIEIVACSTDLGAHKPDPAVYRFAIQKTGHSAKQSAFVGHLGIELEGARAAGMLTIAINQDPGTTADYYCESLKDILSLPIF
jgi:HAD superfamily hydrolase (TIGR01509 family)